VELNPSEHTLTFYFSQKVIIVFSSSLNLSYVNNPENASYPLPISYNVLIYQAYYAAIKTSNIKQIAEGRFLGCNKKNVAKIANQKAIG